MLASRDGHFAAVEVGIICKLIEHHCILTAILSSLFFWYSIYHIFISNQAQIFGAQMLITEGAGIDNRDNTDWTALLYASRHGHLTAVEVAYTFKLV